jgi:hypothetical protein
MRHGVDRWVLKLHGCVSHPEDIVLTREDQLDYDGRRAALAGLAQAMLITRHMLFVGFSLSDDNFHRIAQSVRRVLRTTGRADTEARSFGTALVLTRNPMIEELWGDDIDWVGMSDAMSDRNGPTTARRLELFLDYLLNRVGAYLHDGDDTDVGWRRSVAVGGARQ